MVIILVLVLANGVFAMSEVALISSRKARLQQRAEAGNRGARAALRLAENPNRFLSTVQVGITMIGILSGAFGGAALAQPVADWLRDIPALARYADALGLGLVVLAITYLSLVLGELVPKRLALNRAETIAAIVSPPMSVLSKLAGPVVGLLSLSTEAVLRLMGVRPSDEPPVTEEEVQFMMEEGTQAGVFDAAEQAIVKNLFRMADRRAVSIMTPRSDLIWLNIEDDLQTNLTTIAEQVHMYYPVYREEQRNLLGMISVREILPGMMRGEKPNLENAITEPLYVPENASILKALEAFRSGGQQVAMVINEHGDIEGLITIATVVEAILGEFSDDNGLLDDPDAVQRTDGSWLLDGLMSIEDVEETLRRSVFPQDERGSYQTLGGFIMMRIGRIPSAADFFDWQGLHFEVMDMDGRRVDKILVRILDPETELTPDEDSAAS